MIYVGLALLTLAVFKQTLNFDFVDLDDGIFVSDNPVVNQGFTWQGLVLAFTRGSPANWDPLTTVSHMVDCQLFGLHAGGHHLTNILLHTLTVMLLFDVLRQMTGARWRSAFLAAVFAVHPLRAESVAWVTERKDVLSGLFFVLTLASYARYVHNPWRLTNHLLVAMCLALGLMSKAILITMPLVLLLLDYWPLNRFVGDGLATTRLWRLILEKVPLFALSAAACFAAVWAQNRVHAIQSIEGFPMGLRVANAVDSVMKYTGQWFLPAGLAAYYPYPASVPIWRVILGLMIIGSITVAAWHWRRQRPYLLVGWVWNLVMLLPVIGLVQIGRQARADRYTYLPQIGLALAITWLAAEAWPRWRPRRVILACTGSAAIAVFALAAARQVSFWKNNLALWSHCLAVTTDNPMANNGYGLALVAQNQVEPAITQFQLAAQLAPGNPDVLGNLGSALLQAGRVDAAISQLRLAIGADPASAPHHFILANALFRKNLIPEAISEYESALKADPNYAEAEVADGYVLLQAGRVDDAIAHVQRGVELRPRQANFHYTLATALLKKGLSHEAVLQLKIAMVLQPDLLPAQTKLNEIAWKLATTPMAEARNGAEALDLAEGLVQLTAAGRPVLLETLAAALAETGDFPRAIDAAQHALSLAQQENDTALASRLQEQLVGYRASQPWREVTTAPDAVPN
jgi:tetratricopeptide (TPR) repeat protein